MSTRRRAGAARGLSLIELLIVVTIVGLVSASAVSTYRTYSQRTWRTEAMDALQRIRTVQENHRNQHNTYTGDLAALGLTDGCSDNCVYTIDFPVAPDAGRFTARARPTAGGGRNGVDQNGDTQCQWFSIDAAGRRLSGPRDDCWRR